MANAATIDFGKPVVEQKAARLDPPYVRWTLIALCVGFLSLFLLLPLIAVLVNAFQKGAAAYFQALSDPETFSAVRLTLLTAAIAVPLNMLFGLAAGWSIARFDFRGKRLLITLIEVPVSISPVIAGMVFVLIFGAQGVFGRWFIDHNIRVIFAVPGIILATTFVTFPYIAREIIPTMQALGSEEEEAALTLGASGWQTFFRVTLPNIKWSLLYGIILCNSRAMGEFGAVSVVSGHIRGRTNTLPLYVEILYNDYQFSAAFTVASLLTMLALVTLGAKAMVSWKSGQQERAIRAALAEDTA